LSLLAIIVNSEKINLFNLTSLIYQIHQQIYQILSKNASPFSIFFCFSVIILLMLFYLFNRYSIFVIIIQDQFEFNLYYFLQKCKPFLAPGQAIVTVLYHSKPTYARVNCFKSTRASMTSLI